MGRNLIFIVVGLLLQPKLIVLPLLETDLKPEDEANGRSLSIPPGGLCVHAAG